MRKTLLAATLLVLGGLALMGAGPLDLAFRGPTGNGTPNPVVPDTVRVLTRSLKFPNTAAVTAGHIKSDSYYTNINQGSAGTKVKWGYTVRGGAIGNALRDSVMYVPTASNDYRLRVTSAVAEDNRSWSSTAYMSFIWVDATGLLPGMKVRSAKLLFNVGLFGPYTINSSGIVTARLDTISRDYRMLLGNSVGRYANNDTARFDVTWNQVDKGAAENWDIALDSRDDFHDFGPIAGSSIPAGTYASGTSMSLDVRDAVQQVCDLAVHDPSLLSRGFLFLVYGTRSTGTPDDFQINAGGMYASVGTAGGGNPAFVAEAITVRGTQPWYGAGIPFVTVLDDCYDDHLLYAPVIVNNQLRFDSAIYANGFIGNPDYDTFYTEYSPYIDIMHHGKTHTAWGSITGAALNAELEKANWYSSTYYTTVPDTADIIHAGWPSDTGQDYGLEAMSKLVSYGYQSCRAFSIKDAGTAPIGMITPLSWEYASNLYAIGGIFAGDIFNNGGSPADSAYVHDKLEDRVDIMNSTYGKGAIVVYAHRTTDGLTAENLGYAIRISRRLGCVEPMGYSQMVNWRKSGSVFVDPEDITVANGYTSAQELSAARLDSLRDANPSVPFGTNVTHMWISGKGQ